MICKYAKGVDSTRKPGRYSGPFVNSRPYFGRMNSDLAQRRNHMLHQSLVRTRECVKESFRKFPCDVNVFAARHRWNEKCYEGCVT